MLTAFNFLIVNKRMLIDHVNRRRTKVEAWIIKKEIVLSKLALFGSFLNEMCLEIQISKLCIEGSRVKGGGRYTSAIQLYTTAGAPVLILETSAVLHISSLAALCERKVLRCLNFNS